MKRTAIASLSVLVLIILAGVGLLQAATSEEAVLRFNSEEITLDRSSVRQAAISLSVEDELYVQVELSSGTEDHLNQLLANSRNKALTLALGDRVLLDSVPIHTDAMPPRLRIGVDSIEDGYALLRALNRDASD